MCLENGGFGCTNGADTKCPEGAADLLGQMFSMMAEKLMQSSNYQELIDLL